MLESGFIVVMLSLIPREINKEGGILSKEGGGNRETIYYDQFV